MEQPPHRRSRKRPAILLGALAGPTAQPRITTGSVDSSCSDTSISSSVRQRDAPVSRPTSPRRRPWRPPACRFRLPRSRTPDGPCVLATKRRWTPDLGLSVREVDRAAEGLEWPSFGCSNRTVSPARRARGRRRRRDRSQGWGSRRGRRARRAGGRPPLTPAPRRPLQAAPPVRRGVVISNRHFEGEDRGPI